MDEMKSLLKYRFLLFFIMTLVIEIFPFFLLFFNYIIFDHVTFINVFIIKRKYLNFPNIVYFILFIFF